MNELTTQENYAAQIQRCARALSLGKNDQVTGDLCIGHTLEMLKMFTDGNLDKRYEKLVDQFEFMQEEFEDLDEMIVEYVKTIPLSAYDTGCTDAKMFLEYLEATLTLTPEQHDCIACQHARYALESLAMEHRMEHVHFQEISTLVDAFAPDWGINPDLWVHLNPIRIWATFQTTLFLEEEDETPATVLFYPVHESIRTAVLEDEGFVVAQFLETRPRFRLDDPDWEQTGLSRHVRVEVCKDLAEIGLAAFG